MSSKLEIILKENNSLKNKIFSISKELDFVSKENISLKNIFASHSCHASIDTSPSDKNFVPCSTSFSSTDNDICMLKKSVDCLGSTLSQCAMNHTRLESMFHKKHAPYMHAHKTWHTHAHHAHTHDSLYGNVYTYTPVSYTHLTLPTKRIV